VAAVAVPGRAGVHVDVPGVWDALAVEQGPLGTVLEAGSPGRTKMKYWLNGLKLMGLGALTGLMGTTLGIFPAQAQDLPPEHSGMVLCIGKIINLPLVDIPDEPIEVGLFISDDFKCVRERIG
jgi:hypothetical protein